MNRKVINLFTRKPQEPEPEPTWEPWLDEFYDEQVFGMIERLQHLKEVPLPEFRKEVAEIQRIVDTWPARPGQTYRKP